MKLYTSIGPNPHVVRMFAAEKGLSLEQTTVDLMAGENRQDAHLARNPAGQLPALELHDGSFVTEILPICEYLEEVCPTPVLIGATPQARAKTRMWTRRIDLNIAETMANGFRFSQGLPLFKDRLHCIPQAADDLKAIAQEWLTWLDGQIAGRPFVTGDALTVADILLFCFLDFGASVGQPINPDNKNVADLYARMKARPSATA
jgi:glutathione S-transferase